MDHHTKSPVMTGHDEGGRAAARRGRWTRRALAGALIVVAVAGAYHIARREAPSVTVRHALSRDRSASLRTSALEPPVDGETDEVEPTDTTSHAVPAGSARVEQTAPRSREP